MAETLGEQLKQIRESRNVTLEEIAQKTRIRMPYLQAIEEGDLEAIPSRVQLRGFLRLYAGALNVTLDELAVTGTSQSTEDSQRTVEPSPSDEVQEEEPGIPESTAPPTLDAEPPVPSPTRPEQSFEVEASEDEASEDEAADVPPVPAEARSSRGIFTIIGETLHQRRELLSLSMADVERQTHVRSHYLKAIEAGEFNKLPSPVQAKGMLANYAEFLNLDSDALLLEFARGLQQQRLERQQPGQKSKKAQEISRTRLRLKNFFSLDLLIIAGLFIGFTAFVIWGVNRILDTDTSASPQTTELPEVAEVLLATGTPTVQTLSPDETVPAETGTAAEGEEAATPEATPIFTPSAGDNPIQIVLIPRQRVWVNVTVDDEVVFEGRLLPGNAYDFAGEEKVEILTGNAAALQIYFNDQDIGPTGLIGQVANLVFTQTGLVLPTPTHTPTITETPQASPTSTITPTPSPSPTQEIND
jgi:cytoskeletal protein RodZ